MGQRRSFRRVRSRHSNVLTKPYLEWATRQQKQELASRRVKELAQEWLMFGMQGAFDRLSSQPPPGVDVQEMQEAMDMQMRRIEKLFGFVPGSFARGR